MAGKSGSGTEEEADYKDDDSHVSGILRDENYKNWVKAAEGLVYLQKGLAPFVDREVCITHVLFQSKLPSFGPGTSGCCTLENILPDHGNSVCKFRNCLCKTNVKTRRKCPNSYCSALCDLILNEHKTGNPLWKNSDINAWPTNHWSIAKCYMTTTTPNNSAQTTDAFGLLSVILNGKFFQTKVASQLGHQNDVFLKAKKMRNDIYHRPKMEYTDAELQVNLDILIAVLKDPVSLLHDPDAKLAVKHLESLKQSDVFINPEEEQVILKNRADAINTSKLVQEEQQKAVESVQTEKNIALRELENAASKVIEDIKEQHTGMVKKNFQKLEELVKDQQKDFEDMKTEQKYLSDGINRMESEQKQSVLELREEILKIKAELQNHEQTTSTTSTIYGRVGAKTEDEKTKEDAESLLIETAREYLTKPKEGTYSVSELVQKFESFAKDVENTDTKMTDVRKGSVVFEFKCLSLDALIDLLDYFCNSRFQARLDGISMALEQVFNKRIHLSGFIVPESLQDVIKQLRHMQNEKMVQFEMTCSGADGLLHVLDVFEGNKAANSLNELSEALSDTLKRPVTLRTSIDIDQMKREIDSLKMHIAAADANENGRRHQDYCQPSGLDGEFSSCEKGRYSLRHTPQLEMAGAQRQLLPFAELKEYFCHSLMYGRTYLSWPGKTIIYYKVAREAPENNQAQQEYDDLLNAQLQQPNIQGQNAEWSRTETDSNSRTHAEVILIDELNVRGQITGLRNGDYLEISMVMSYSPCNSCSKLLLKFKRDIEIKGVHVRIKIKVANFYKYPTETRMLRELVQENGFEFSIFQGLDDWRSFYEDVNGIGIAEMAIRMRELYEARINREEEDTRILAEIAVKPAKRKLKET